MDVINEKLKLVRTKLDKYPAAQEAEVGHRSFVLFLSGKDSYRVVASERRKFRHFDLSPGVILLKDLFINAFMLSGEYQRED